MIHLTSSLGAYVCVRHSLPDLELEILHPRFIYVLKSIELPLQWERLSGANLVSDWGRAITNPPPKEKKKRITAPTLCRITLESDVTVFFFEVLVSMTIGFVLSILYCI